MAPNTGRTTPMEGQRHGYLVVLERAGSILIGNRKKFAAWRCRCDCGQEVVVGGQILRNGARKSCAMNGHRWTVRKTRGLTMLYRSEYKSWASMWDRCTKSRVKNYKNYGGRGIKICDRWKSFAAFLEDMKPKSSSDLMIERDDTDGDYEPNNCRWATNAEQQRNRRNSVYVEYEGQRMLLIDVVAKLGLTRGLVIGRLKGGWPLDAALSIPVRPCKKGAERKPRKK